MTGWQDVAGRVAVEACVPDANDRVVMLGWSPIVDALAARVGSLVVVDPTATAELPAGARYHRAERDAPPRLAGVSVVVAHWSLRLLSPDRQRALITKLGRELGERALLVIGDVIWSLPPESVDEPEQFGDNLTHAPTAETLTGWVRDAGFLPDLHRFGPAVGVMIALRSGR